MKTLADLVSGQGGQETVIFLLCPHVVEAAPGGVFLWGHQSHSCGLHPQDIVTSQGTTFKYNNIKD